MNEIKKWYYETVGKEIVEKLKEKKYNAVYVDSLEEAKTKVLEIIPKGSSIALGGSMTLEEMNMVEEFRNGNYKLYDRYQKLPFSEIVEIMRQSMLADYLVTGTNAVTKNGELVNMDSTGNRAAGMIFGPKNVIVVIGANKVVENFDEAMNRLKTIAPMNAKRLSGHDTPCKKTAVCDDCQIKHRICNYISVVNNGAKFEGRFTVIVIGSDIGL